MKIAITGHSAGIGKSFAHRLSAQGHEIVGISKRDGHNIRVIPKISAMIQPCDMWINNAQSGYAQTELLYKVWEQWKNDPNKMIWIISTMLTQHTGLVNIPGMTETSLAEYKNQKRSLEDAFYQLKNQCRYPLICLIRPGQVATQPGQTANEHGADPDAWVDTVCDLYTHSRLRNLWPEEISLGFIKQTPEL